MPDKAKINLNVYNGSRRLIDDDISLLIKIRDGMHKVHFDVVREGPQHSFSVPFNNNMADNYIVVISADDHLQAGFHPVKVLKNQSTVLDLMLLPKHAGFDFTEARWENLEANNPLVFDMISSGASAANARARYEKFMAEQPGSLAAFFNVTTAARDVNLPNKTALEYFKQIIWDEERMGQDRFFVFADAEMVNQVKQAAQQGEFQPQGGLDINHPGATCSFKQKQFGEANIQFSFHENTKKTIGGTNCVKLEVDMDYFKSLIAHALLEVLPNKVSNGKTDPRKIYLLRWIAGRRAGVPEFDPPYFIGALG
ncbi:MAG TPA: hypothetical protein VJS64_10155 [Pyrinomonadaceae bacterium]|nr:hypothetical protein [Pyrinomonadaceae bacterium]